MDEYQHCLGGCASISPPRLTTRDFEQQDTHLSFVWVGGWLKELQHIRNMTEGQITAQVEEPSIGRSALLITFLFLILKTRAGAEGIIERPHCRMVRGWKNTRMSLRYADTNEQRGAMFVLASIVMEFWNFWSLILADVTTSQKMDNLHEYCWPRQRTLARGILTSHRDGRKYRDPTLSQIERKAWKHDRGNTTAC